MHELLLNLGDREKIAHLCLSFLGLHFDYSKHVALALAFRAREESHSYRSNAIFKSILHELIKTTHV